MSGASTAWSLWETRLHRARIVLPAFVGGDEAVIAGSALFGPDDRAAVQLSPKCVAAQLTDVYRYTVRQGVSLERRHQ